MENLRAGLRWLQATPLAEAIQDSDILFPAFETLHVLTLALLFGTIAQLDLRLLDWTGRGRPVSVVAREVLPWTWAGFTIAVLSGSLLFLSSPLRYADNPTLRIKLLLLALAGANALAFHLASRRGTWARDAIGTPPAAARGRGGIAADLDEYHPGRALDRLHLALKPGRGDSVACPEVRQFRIGAAGDEGFGAPVAGSNMARRMRPLLPP